MEELFPKREGFCACGCGRALSGKRTKWFDDSCRLKALRRFQIIKGDTGVIRQSLFKRDHGFCCRCGAYSEDWEADHIIPVSEGGGGYGLENFQTLCKECHKEKTSNSYSIPDRGNSFAPGLYILFPSFNTFRTLNKGVRKDIIRKAVF